MASGNFLVGDGISLKVFDYFVQSNLEEKGYFVKDKLPVMDGNEARKKILISVVGEGNLEVVLNNALVESGVAIEQTTKEMKNNIDYEGAFSNYTVSHCVNRKKNEEGKTVQTFKGTYKTLGLYDIDDTASKLFPIFAQEYLLKDMISIKTAKLEMKIKDLLNKKLSDF